MLRCKNGRGDGILSRLINTEEFIKRIDHYPPDIRDTAKKELRYCKTVDAIPVVHGHWIPSNTPDAFWVCSCCGFPSEAHGAFKLYKYCPQCGAKMDEVTES